MTQPAPPVRVPLVRRAVSGAGILVTVATFMTVAFSTSNSTAARPQVVSRTLHVAAASRVKGRDADAPSALARGNAATSSTTIAALSVAAAPAAATAAPAVVQPKATPVAKAAPAGSPASASDHSFLGPRWNPCRVITVHSSGPDVAGIVSELASITGLRLQMVSGAADITVTWGNGLGGGELGVTLWQAAGEWLSHVSVVIDWQAQPYLATVLRHELGHAAGLRHANQANEVMYRSAGPGSPTDYQAGDLAGLRAVGASAGC